ncbi:sensor histidine kinase [Candidatus Margulisiibacteriota bacterium]
MDEVEAVNISAEDRGLAIKLEIDPELPSIMGDEIKLKRVVTNLVGNALKFTARGGEIRIKARPEAPGIRVEVIDNGVGIAGEYLGKIFDKFFQVDSSYTRATGGIGMGLAIARELVELHGGKIWVESGGLGKGSRFNFTLPSE